MRFETDIYQALPPHLTFTEAFETVHRLLKQIGFDSCTFVSTEYLREKPIVHSSCPAE